MMNASENSHLGKVEIAFWRQAIGLIRSFFYRLMNNMMLYLYFIFCLADFFLSFNFPLVDEFCMLQFS